jgi:hypothetical protein
MPYGIPGREPCARFGGDIGPAHTGSQLNSEAVTEAVPQTAAPTTSDVTR